LTRRAARPTLPAAVSQNHTLQVHATCVELAGSGILLRGEPGCGKSDLALRLIDTGARLVADDRTDLASDGARLLASAPPAISGRIEVRGLGIVSMPAVAKAVVRLAVDLLPEAGIERLPTCRMCTYLGVDLPLLRLAPFEASAVAKLRLAVRETVQGRLFIH
jgi:serine kinase of HPr protein (carbohydrate metabolism regulator)